MRRNSLSPPGICRRDPDRGADQLYLSNNQRVLGRSRPNWTAPELATWQQERILRNHVRTSRNSGNLPVRCRWIRDRDQPRRGPGSLNCRPRGSWNGRRLHRASTHRRDGLPTTTMAFPVKTPSGNGSQPNLARTTLANSRRSPRRQVRVRSARGRERPSDRPRCGTDAKNLIAADVDSTPEQRLATALRRGREPLAPTSSLEPTRRTYMVVAARISVPDWTVIVEHPQSEALEVALSFERQLLAASASPCSVTVGAGGCGAGRSSAVSSR